MIKASRPKEHVTYQGQKIILRLDHDNLSEENERAYLGYSRKENVSFKYKEHR